MIAEVSRAKRKQDLAGEGGDVRDKGSRKRENQGTPKEQFSCIPPLLK